MLTHNIIYNSYVCYKLHNFNIYSISNVINIIICYVINIIHYYIIYKLVNYSPLLVCYTIVIR